MKMYGNGRPRARQAAYTAIDTERDYQDRRWGGTASSRQPARPGTARGAQDRTIDEFALYILHEANQLGLIAGSTDDAVAKLDRVRKVGALAVACMERHGALSRKATTRDLEQARARVR